LITNIEHSTLLKVPDIFSYPESFQIRLSNFIYLPSALEKLLLFSQDYFSRADATLALPDCQISHNSLWRRGLAKKHASLPNTRVNHSISGNFAVNGHRKNFSVNFDRFHFPSGMTRGMMYKTQQPPDLTNPTTSVFGVRHRTQTFVSANGQNQSVNDLLRISFLEIASEEVSNISSSVFLKRGGQNISFAAFHIIQNSLAGRRR